MYLDADHPGAARLTVRVGVAGHRRNDLAAAHEGELRATIRRVLAEIGKVAAAFHLEAGALYDAQAPLLRVISPLAEGADRLVAEEALRLGFELQCLLPFPREAYVEDFADWDSVAQFETLLEQATAALELDGPTDRELRSEAYQAVGRAILRQCDILVVVWDGKPAKGIGGTGQIVGEAAVLDIPTVWISSTPPHQANLWDAEQGRGTILGDDSLLSMRLRSTFLLPQGNDLGHPYDLIPGISEAQRAQRYLCEKRPLWTMSIFFALFHHFWAWTWKPLEMRLPNFRRPGPRSWSVGWQALLALRPDIAERMERVYFQHYDWADGLAKFYAGRYRSAFVLAYSLGAFAVLVAFLGVRTGWHAWFFGELALILLILGITHLGRRQGWHERWMDYRLLAENLRQMQFLDLLGRVPSSFKVPVYMEVGDPRRSWFNCHFRALVRQAGVISTRIDRDYLQRYRDVLGESIQSQIDYHGESSEMFHAVHRRAHLVAQGFFYLAFFVGLVHITPFHTSGLPGLALDVLAVVLPGFGGALGAILHHGEFDRVAARSRALEPRLRRLKEELSLAGAMSRELGQVAETFSDLALAELLDWRFVFLEKNLVLPG